MYQQSSDEPLLIINEFKAKYKQNYNLWSTEEKLIFDNILLLEKSNFLVEEDAKQAYTLLSAQDLACEEFFKNKKPQDVDKWFLTSWADIKSRLTPFLSMRDMYTQSTKTKNLYKEALKQDTEFSPALRGDALWLFFAPRIAGGGYSKALKQMSRAIEYAQTDMELFFALTYRSQIFFAMEKETERLEDLEKAHSIFPRETLTYSMKEANKNGKNFF